MLDRTGFHASIVPLLEADEPRAWLSAGEALERVLLEITRAGYAVSPLVLGDSVLFPWNHHTGPCYLVGLDKTTGEIAYPYVLRTIHDVGYRDPIGLEMSPKSDPTAAFEAIRRVDAEARSLKPIA